MIMPVWGRVCVVALAVSAMPLRAELLSETSINRYIDNHQEICVATLTRQVQSAGQSLPFGFVDNFCLCMGKGMFSEMTLAQERELQSASGGLSADARRQQAELHNSCAVSTAAFYTADFENTAN